MRNSTKIMIELRRLRKELLDFMESTEENTKPESDLEELNKKVNVLECALSRQNDILCSILNKLGGKNERED